MNQKMHISRVDVVAGNQFGGDEFRVTPYRPNTVLKLKEINLQLGSGSKTYRIEKRDKDGSLLSLIQQSIDPQTGAPAPTTAESLIITGPEFETILAPGQQIQVITSGAVNDMRAVLYLAETTFDAA